MKPISTLLLLFLLTTNAFAQWNLKYHAASATPPLTGITKHYSLQSPDGQNLVTYQFSNDTNLLKSSDFGATWTPLSYSGPGSFIHMLFFDADTGVVFSEAGINRTTDGGQSWTFVSTSEAVSYPQIHPNGSLYFVGSDSNLLDLTIYRSTDKALSWDTVSGFSAPTSLVFRFHLLLAPKLLVLNDSTYLMNDFQQIYRSDNYGNTWASVGPGGLLGGFQWLSDSVIYFHPTFGGTTIHKSTDQGLTWPASQSITPPAACQTARFANEQVGYVSGIGVDTIGFSTIVMYRTSDGGTSWNADTIIGFPNFQSTSMNELLVLNSDTAFATTGTDVQGSEPGIIIGTLNGGVEATGIEIPQLVNDLQFKAFPNPTRERVTITWSQGSQQNEFEYLRLFNLNLQLVKEVSINSQQQAVSLDLQDLPAGSYLYQLVGNMGASQLGKLVKPE